MLRDAVGRVCVEVGLICPTSIFFKLLHHFIIMLFTNDIEDRLKYIKQF